jgi:acetyl/propionyl-CoA carboxylase alpha subunit
MRSYIVESDVLGSALTVVVRDDPSTTIGETSYTIEHSPEVGIWHVRTDSGTIPAVVECEPTGIVRIVVRGYVYSLRCCPERLEYFRALVSRAEQRERGSTMVRAPMPGLVKAVHLAEGGVVQRGESIVVLEAMKMENILRAPATGIVRRISVAPGVTVEKGDVLCTIEADGTL